MTGLSWQAATLILALAWFAALNLAGSVVALAAAQLFDDRLTASASRARRLLALRLAPALLSLSVTALVFVPAHIWLEPVRPDEKIGLVALMLAAAGLLLLLCAAFRSARAVGRTVRLATLAPQREIQRGAIRIMEVPGLSGVALAGIVRPRILIGTGARRVLTAAELDLAVAHERAHQRAGDNLSRLLIYCAPDFLGWVAQGGRLERLWEAEAECLADAAAADGNPARARRLASALVKVARLASAADRTWSPGWSTFHHAALLQTRVRLLVSGTRVTPATARYVPAAAACGLAAVATAWITGLPRQLHWLTEVLIAVLP
jgi:beta-lactamase regulating signal transducer with metallopeptidase domain